MANYRSLFFATVTSAVPFTIPEGFLYASLDVESTASYTITNTVGLPAVPSTSGAVTNAFTFPYINIDGWAAHTITVSTGTVVIVYTTGL
jgi:hypothetical protein